MADRITRCPHCSTSFRVTDSHLQIARGAVRCGSCLQIFQALEHLIAAAEPAVAESPTATESPSVAESPTATESPSADARPALDASPAASADPEQPAARKAFAFHLEEDEDDLLISDDMVTADKSLKIEGKLSDTFIRSSQTGERTLFDRQPQQRYDPGKGPGSDESWAEELLRETDEELASLPPQPAPANLSDTAMFALLDSDTLNTLAPAEPGPAQSAATPPHAARTTTGHTGADNNPPPAAAAAEPEPRPFSALDADAADSELNQPLDTPAAGERFGEPGPVKPTRNALHPERDAMIGRIEPEALELHAPPPGRSWGRELLWFGLSLVATAALIVQAGWFKAAELSKREPFRSVYQQVCPLLGCQVTELRDTRQIKTYNLVVRSHPQNSKALIVDAMLINNADFKQPFPVLNLAFSDLNNRPVASRRFSPGEYLGGELAGTAEIPPDQPVHIALEIVDPGPNAVNYRLDIVH